MKNKGINLKIFNIQEHLQDTIYCIDLINLKNDTTVDTIVYLDKDERNDFLVFYNKYNKDKNYTYIATDYYINEEGEMEIC